MADTNHATPPVEGDGVDYKGIVWFLVILVGTVVFCQVFVWGLFVWTESRVVASDAARAPLAAAPAAPHIAGGRLVTGTEPAPVGGALPRPGLLVAEPTVLGAFRQAQDAEMTTYGWVNQGAGVIRLPIQRAKELALQRGFSVRGAPAATSAPPTVVTAPGGRRGADAN